MLSEESDQLPVGTDDGLVEEPEGAKPSGPAPVFGFLGQLPTASGLVGLAIAVVCSIFVLLQLRPDLLVADTTPSGGDMGAHVWGPAYMRDNLLSSGRLTGWTPDWYAGFPAYHFYMVVPALAILAVNAGFNPLFGVPMALVALGGAFAASRRWPEHRALAWSVAGLVSVLVIALPYGISFKLVAVAGLVLFPLSAYAMGRLAGSPQPLPGFMALGATVFLFDTNFTIYGGNIASTLAGEFAFSLSLCLSLIAIGLAARGMEHGAGRASATVVIALVALCHVIPLFFAMAALVLLVLLDRALPRTWVLAVGITMALIPVGMAEGSSLAVQAAAIGSFLVVAASVVVADPRVLARAQWLIVVGPTAALMSMFWLAPFYLRSDYFNDMGWERLDDVGPALLTTPMLVALPIAAIGGVLSFAVRDRMGILFTILGLTFAAAVANLPAGKLWNARLLPFYYLSVFVVAAIGIGLVVRFAAAAVAERLDAPDRTVLVSGSLAALLATLVVVAFPLRILPRDSVNEEGAYSWFGITSDAKSFIPSWVAWNFSGYEEKRSFGEYRTVVDTMAGLGATNGCGRAMWEYDKGLDRYGTPMALMLLPHWTDGCIGSMEGLYFESSATTPFHFLNQSMLSAAPSRAQRELPYQSFDIDKGVTQLQTMGVRYYMAQSDEAIEAARNHEYLTEVAESQPFVIFQVADSQLVEGLDVMPVVASGPASAVEDELNSRFDVGWLSQAVAFYNDPTTYRAIPAIDGPDDWQRVTSILPSDGEPVEAAVVSNIEVETDTIRFEVDQVGTPVLVKTSYFPNWQANGADGPWQAGPNLMLVVPTETSVELYYGKTAADRLGSFLSLLGIASLLVMAFRRKQGDALSVIDPVAGDGREPAPTVPMIVDIDEVGGSIDEVGGSIDEVGNSIDSNGEAAGRPDSPRSAEEASADRE